MTIKEAMKELEAIKCWRCYNLTINAVEKQMPMKPVYDDLCYYFCPRCGHPVGNVIDEPQKYCDECGQKLDWHISQNHCSDCKWYKKIEQCGEIYTVCWLPFKKNPNGVNTVSSINDDDKGCSEFERSKT